MPKRKPKTTSDRTALLILLVLALAITGGVCAYQAHVIAAQSRAIHWLMQGCQL